MSGPEAEILTPELVDLGSAELLARITHHARQNKPGTTPLLVTKVLEFAMSEPDAPAEFIPPES